MVTMTPVLVLCILLCAASAAPSEKIILPADVSEPQEEMMRMIMKEEEQELPEDLLPELRDGAEFQEVEDPEACCTPCPTGWHQYSGVCYKAFTDSRSWFDALENCSSYGAKLPSVPTALHYNFLQQLSISMKVKEAWLGGLYVQDQYVWIDGQKFIFYMWGSKYTDDTSYPCLYLRSSGGWSNSACSSSRQYTCAKRAEC